MWSSCSYSKRCWGNQANLVWIQKCFSQTNAIVCFLSNCDRVSFSSESRLLAAEAIGREFLSYFLTQLMFWLVIFISVFSFLFFVSFLFSFLSFLFCFSFFFKAKSTLVLGSCRFRFLSSRRENGISYIALCFPLTIFVLYYTLRTLYFSASFSPFLFFFTCSLENHLGGA